MRTMRTILLATLALVTLPTLAAAQPRMFTLDGPRRAWLGFSYDPIIQRDRDAAPAGVVVREVVASSPAERAGLEVGDTIIRINDINATDQLLTSLGSALSPGDEVRIDVRRAGRVRSFTVTAARPPADYVALGPTTGIFRFDPDTVRSMVRIFIDSARMHVDSLRLPDVFIDGRRIAPFFPDSSRFGFYMDTTFMRGDTIHAFRFFSSDSLRMHFDSLRTRMFIEPERLDRLRDSLVLRLRSAPGSTVFTSPDSTFVLRYDGSPAPMLLGRSAIAGAELTRVDPALGEYFGVEAGVLVVRVPRGTPAARAGLEGGDIIVRAGDTEVTTVEELRRAIQQARGDDAVRLEVVRKRERITVRLRRD